MPKQGKFELELNALETILEAFEPLDATQRQFVLNTACERLELKRIGSAPPSDGLPTPPLHSTGNPPDISEGGSPKDFLRAKSPKTDVQRIACLAYYLTHSRNQPLFKTKDLSDLNTEAAQSKMSNPSAAVRNATDQNKYLAQANKGQKQITAYGEDVVRTLPDQVNAKALAKPNRPRRRRKIKKRASKR